MQNIFGDSIFEELIYDIYSHLPVVELRAIQQALPSDWMSAMALLSLIGTIAVYHPFHTAHPRIAEDKSKWLDRVISVEKTLTKHTGL